MNPCQASAHMDQKNNMAYSTLPDVWTLFWHYVNVEYVWFYCLCVGVCVCVLVGQSPNLRRFTTESSRSNPSTSRTYWIAHCRYHRVRNAFTPGTSSVPTISVVSPPASLYRVGSQSVTCMRLTGG